MPYIHCALCKKDDSSHKMSYCSTCDLWVHRWCANSGFLAPKVYCPSCQRRLRE